MKTKGMNTKNIILAVLFSILIFSGCEDVLYEEPFPILTNDNFYLTDVHAIMAVNGVYDLLSNRSGAYAPNKTYGMDGHLMIMHLISDINYNNNSNAAYGFQIATATINENEPTMTNVWALSYGLINRANNVLLNVPDVSMDSILQQRLIGEAKFLRAFAYFNLVRYWGDVPIHNEETRDFNGIDLPRSPIQEVYNLIISDLEFAENSLYYKYGAFDPELETKVYDVGDNGRATVAAAQAMLAKVYLSLGSYKRHSNVEVYDWVNDVDNYNKAIEYCNNIINSRKYSLLYNFGELFLTTNKYHSEAIFEVQHDKDSEQGGIFGGWQGGYGRFKSRPEFAALFDVKLDVTNDAVVDSLTDYRFPLSVKLSDNKDLFQIIKFGIEGENYDNKFSTDVNVPILRYADVLLMLAEAINEIEGPGNAYQWINYVRYRARSSNPMANAKYPQDVFGLTQNEFRLIVWDERKRELSFELHSWFDLVRTGTFLEKVRATKSYIQAKDILNPTIDSESLNPTITAENIADYHIFFPIPGRERDINSSLTQNDGYAGN